MYYKQSGKFNVGRSILFLIPALVITVLLSFAYAWLFRVFSSVEIKTLIMLGMGAVLGFVLKNWIRSGHIRSVPVAVAGGVLIFATFAYVHFLGYVMVSLRQNRDPLLDLLLWARDLDPVPPDDLFYWLRRPRSLAEFARLFNELGTHYRMGRYSYSAVRTASGAFLALFWAIEHIIVLGLAARGLRVRVPYIEADGYKEWGVEHHIAMFEKLPDTIREQMERRDYTAFENAAAGIGFGGYCTLSYFSDKEDWSGECYLAVKRLTRHTYRVWRWRAFGRVMSYEDGYRPTEIVPQYTERVERYRKTELVRWLKAGRADIERLKQIAEKKTANPYA